MCVFLWRVQSNTDDALLATKREKVNKNHIVYFRNELPYIKRDPNKTMPLFESQIYRENEKFFLFLYWENQCIHSISNTIEQHNTRDPQRIKKIKTTITFIENHIYSKMHVCSIKNWFHLNYFGCIFILAFQTFATRIK